VVSDLESRVAALEKNLADMKQSLERFQVNSLLPLHVQQANNLQLPNNNEDFENLKVLLNSKHWPAAVDPAMLCGETDEHEKSVRGENILDVLIDLPLENLSFLDFGCGEGHVVQAAKRQRPKVAVGFDIVHSHQWANFPADNKVKYTTNWEEVVNSGPYNVIMMYDVIDHIGTDTQEVVEALIRAKHTLAPQGRIYARVHPYCSRHATHLYHKLNKAYVHLIFNEDEMNQLGIQQQKMLRIMFPQHQYNDIFNRAGLRILRKGNVLTQRAEKFFTDVPLVANRIRYNWKDEPTIKNGGFPENTGMQFLDFVLVG
jgi:2-polyprenyl-3-methyl-5-hydroxy-6-metoxy-1,4-benzoquinol methylase